MSAIKNTSSSIRTFAQDLEKSKKSHGVAPAATPDTFIPTTPTAPPTSHPPLPPIPKKAVPKSVPTAPSKIKTLPEQNKQQGNKNKKPLPPIPHVHQPAAKSPTPIVAKPTTHKIDTSELEKSLPKNASSILVNDNSDDIDFDSDTTRATVVTDRKHKRLTLFGAIASLINSAWQTIKHEYTHSKEPKYTVASAERRRGIIQSATTKTGRDSISDHQRVVKKIRALQTTDSTLSEIEADPEHLLEAPDHTTTWGSESDTQTKKLPDTSAWAAKLYAPIQSPEPAGTWDTEATTTKPATNREPPTPTPKIVPVPSTTAPTSPAQSKHVPSQTITPITLDPNTNQDTTPKIQPTTPPPIQPQVPSQPNKVRTSVPAVPSKPKTNTPDPTRVSWTDKLSTYLTRTNILISIGAGAVVFVAVTLFIVQPQNYIQPQTGQNNTNVSETTNGVPENTIPVIQLSQLLAGALTSSEINASEAVVIFDVINDISNEPVHTTLLVEVNNRLPQNFIDTVTSLQVGVFRQQPFIIFNVQDTNMALGGMFQWENNLAQNMSNILGMTATTTRTGDMVIAGSDVRLFTTAEGDTLLLYGITDNRIIITTTEQVFTNVVDTIISNN